MKTAVNLVGAGRVGGTLLRLLADTPAYAATGLARRDPSRPGASPDGVTAGHLADLPAADLWLLAVPDGAIAGVASEIAALGPPPATAIHFSGYHPAAVMGALRGWRLASAHPNLSFADPETAARRFSGTHVAVEGDEAAVAIAEALMDALGARCFRIGAEAKPLYHAAAVLANNFPVALQSLALDAWREAGVPEDIARDLGASLLAAAAANVADLGAVAALTGPAARGDAEVIRVETEALGGWRGEAGEIYAALSRLALRLGAEGRDGGG